MPNEMKYFRKIIAMALFCLPLFFFNPFPANASDSPCAPTDGWRDASPESQGVDSGMLIEMVLHILDNHYKIDSITIVRNGRLITDAYFSPFEKGKKHRMASCAKSITATLIGIAVDKGFIESVNHPLLEFFPDEPIQHVDDLKRAITLEHVLTMTSGLNPMERKRPGWSGADGAAKMDDWARAVLDRPVIGAPGVEFKYNNGGSHLLSAIIQKTTRMSALDFARRHLFGPLGVADVEWDSDPRGVNIGGSKMWMTPHDMAKIGWLHLRDGVWDGVRIVSRNWIESATRSHVDVRSSTATFKQYGYQWWIDAPAGCYIASGSGGQFIFVMPEKNMVVVFTGRLSNHMHHIPYVLLTKYITPAARASGPLPPNPKKESRLLFILERIAGARNRGD